MSIFIYGQLPVLTEKRIFSAGIDNRDHNKWCFFTFACMNLNKRVRNNVCCRYCIIQQIAKQRGKVIVCNKICCPTSYVGMKSQEVVIKPILKIVLESDNQQLDEVMVVAYGTTKRLLYRICFCCQI